MHDVQTVEVDMVGGVCMVFERWVRRCWLSSLLGNSLGAMEDVQRSMISRQIS